MSRQFRSLLSTAPWSTVLGLVVSVTAVALGLRFGAAGLAGTIAIGLFALFVSAAIISSRRRPDSVARGSGTAPTGPPER